jgi:Ca2+-binding RTX toxin-like protein
MSVFTGKTIHIGSHVIDLPDVMPGTDNTDFFNAGGGADTIFAGGGSDIVGAGSGDDTIFAGSFTDSSVRFWGNDIVIGDDGNDKINYQNTTADVTIYGDQPTIDGSQPHNNDGNDTIFSGSGNDHITGGLGNDIIHGGAGNDVINGDYWFMENVGGNDTIVGGQGRDLINTGGGSDTIVFSPGDSTPVARQEDEIEDFDTAHDHIQILTGAHPTSSNYIEAHLPGSANNMVTDFGVALQKANTMLDDTHSYVFLTNGHDGYLFASFDHHHFADIAIKLDGLTSLSDFSHSNLLV